jgi:hypothetical protein
MSESIDQESFCGVQTAKGGVRGVSRREGFIVGSSGDDSSDDGVFGSGSNEGSATTSGRTGKFKFGTKKTTS